MLLIDRYNIILKEQNKQWIRVESKHNKTDCFRISIFRNRINFRIKFQMTKCNGDADQKKTTNESERD